VAAPCRDDVISSRRRALIAAALGFVFAVLGLRRQGWIALSGLVLLALLPWVAALAPA
jgi:hypothetical protein